MPDTPSMKVITLGARATIERAEQIQSDLVEALENSDRVLINLSHVEAMDLTAIHLLYAAGREAEVRKKELSFTGTVPEVVRTALENGGFCRLTPQDARTLAKELLDFAHVPSGTVEGGDRG